MQEKQTLITTQEAAKALGITDNHLRNLIINGKANPARQIGGTWMFTLDEIERVRNRPKRGRK